MQRLMDKIALITGAASGIGLATAQRFVAEGATVVMTDSSRDRLATAFATVGASGLHRSMHLDVTLEEDWISVIREVDAIYGRLDVLVNNAGDGKPNLISETTLQEWRQQIAVNLDSVFLGTKHSLPLLTRSGRGSIVNVSSVIALVGSPKSGSYAAAKGGVRLFTKTTALECAAARNGVRANSLHPGQIKTPLLLQNLQNNPARADELLSRIPIGRMGEPPEIADAMVFLASNESSFMTGAELIIDGGYTAQ